LFSSAPYLGNERSHHVLSLLKRKDQLAEKNDEFEAFRRAPLLRILADLWWIRFGGWCAEREEGLDEPLGSPVGGFV
jgi:hypothetical protein